MAKQKYYAVKVGMTPGVYLTWDECKVQVTGYSGADYKSFPTMEEAAAYAGVACGESGEHGGDSTAVECISLPKKMSVCLENNGTEMSMPPLEEGAAIAYVDGSYNAATKEYSCGVVFMVGEEQIHMAKRGESQELASMRNVAGEILGAELAMKKAMELGIRKLSIYHDYEGIAAWCLGRWKTNKEGTRAYKEYFDSIKDRIAIEFVKVKGHSGDVYNDKADELAKSVIFPEED